MAVHRLERRQYLEHPLDEVFAFFARRHAAVREILDAAATGAVA
jgi:hypothetical protein